MRAVVFDTPEDFEGEKSGEGFEPYLDSIRYGRVFLPRAEWEVNRPDDHRDDLGRHPRVEHQRVVGEGRRSRPCIENMPFQPIAYA